MMMIKTRLELDFIKTPHIFTMLVLENKCFAPQIQPSHTTCSNKSSTSKGSKEWLLSGAKESLDGS